MNNEPVAIIAAITGAVQATLAILLFAGVDPQFVGALTAAAVAWIGVGAVLVRAKVTPVEKAIIGRAIVPEQPDRGVAPFDLIVSVLIVVILVLLVLKLA